MTPIRNTNLASNLMDHSPVREPTQNAVSATRMNTNLVPQRAATTDDTFVQGMPTNLPAYNVDMYGGAATAYAPTHPAPSTQASGAQPPSSSKFGEAMNGAKADGRLELYEVYHALALMADPDQVIEKLRNGDKDTLELMKTDAGLALIKQKIADAGALKDAFMSIIDDENNRRNRLAQNLGGR